MSKIEKSVCLSDAEVEALRKHAKRQLLHCAGEDAVGRHDWRRLDDPSFEQQRQHRAGPDLETSPAQRQEYEDEARRRLLGAAETFGALDHARHAFARVRGVPKNAHGVVEIEFSDRAYAWIEEERTDWFAGLEVRRGTCEVELGDGTKFAVFVKWILDGLAEQLAAAGDEVEAVAV